MEKSLRILLPSKYAKSDVFLEGFVTFSSILEISIYITGQIKTLQYSHIGPEPGWINGFICNEYKSKTLPSHIQLGKNHIIIEHNKENILHIQRLVLENKVIEDVSNSIFIFYDETSIYKSEALCYGTENNLTKLKCLLRDECLLPKHINNEEISISTNEWVSASMFALHLINYMKLICWLLSPLKNNRKISIKQLNFLFAVIMDVCLGWLFLQLLPLYKEELSAVLMSVLEKLVDSMYTLLKWLMGAPAGLKLNNAFNKMLGKYFSYHVQLWWLFLDVSSAKLVSVLQLFHYLGYFGLTFQAAMLSDVLCIATFHAYCIYVYAARLFNIQVSGLIALLRLFVGRKYNPLRRTIDSCEYTNQQLFVGTVAFTILLLLLPTTTMYYIVFTLFRLLSITAQYSLARVIYWIQTLPLYVVSLWLFHSPKVSGKIQVDVVSNAELSPLVLNIKLLRNPLTKLINTFTAPVTMPRPINWATAFKNMFVGKQIV